MSKTKSLTDLANFVGRASTPRKERSGFWDTCNSVSFSKNKTHTTSASDLLAMVMTISARTRRVIAPRTLIELDVFSPNGKRAVQLIMGPYNDAK